MELKEILYERNELKARVSDLEDELSIYRPSTTSVRPYVCVVPFACRPLARACDAAALLVLLYLWGVALRWMLFATFDNDQCSYA